MNLADISTVVSTTINEIFYKIFSSIDNNLYSILDKFTFINSDILNDSYFGDILGGPNSNGILLIANSLIFGYLIYYAFKLLFSHLGICQVERPSQFLFKLLIYAICMNFSFFICDEIIYLVSTISAAICDVGENIFHTKICFSSLISQLNSVLTIDNSLDVFSLDGIIKTLISFGLLNLVITYAVRFVLIKVFVLLSPFSFLSLCNKSTSILFKSWFTSFLSLLLIQVFVSIVLLLIFSLKISNSNMMSKFILIAAIFILIRANSYVREMLGGISSDVNIGFNNLKSMIFK